MEGEESNLLAYWRDHIGSPLDPQVIAKSPARSAATIRAPILLLHGTEDTVVPLAQSKMMARALDAANRQYSLVELPGDDHYLSTSATRVLMLGELEKFLAPFLAAAPAAQTSN
jgi:dipeptidyl aminopeptidase/acylaminoacyl peptidase